jgi:hypothetical protein
MPRLSVLCLLAACQSPLATPMVSLEPADADSGDDLVATVAGVDDYELVWFRNGSAVDGLTDGVVPASMTRRGDTWRVEATARRKRKSVVGEASTSIRNAVPAVTLTLAPKVPQAGDALVVAAIADDADDDPISIVMSWTRDGEVVDIRGDTVPADTTRRGEVWAVEVVANDGFGQGPAARAEATIINAAPSVLGASLTPTAPRTTDDVQLAYSVEDSDGDPVQVEVRWSISGDLANGITGRTLPASLFHKGDKLYATVVATDGSSEGEPVTVGPVTVVNTPPSAPGVRIEPDDPIAGEALRCAITAQPTDADGDAMAGWRAAWSVDGVMYDGNVASVVPGDTVPAGVTQGDERWACSMQAHDGEEWGAFTYAARTVDWDGFLASQVVAGRTVTCTSVSNDDNWTQCTGLRVAGKAFPNGLSCSLGWSSTASPSTDHASFCALVTGSTSFQAEYTCGTVASRVTWIGGAWGARDDNGYTQSLRCHW